MTFQATLYALDSVKKAINDAYEAGYRAGRSNEWVDLTDEEIADLADDYRSQYIHGGQTYDEFDYKGFARAIEAKRKEKNK